MTNSTLARAPTQSDTLATITGSSRDPARITKMLEEAGRHFHLVSPATSVGAIGEGCTVAIAAVKVDVERETYQIAGSSDRGLGLVALNRIAAAANVSWDSERSHRADDGRDPYFCHYVACGSFRSFDGSPIMISGEKILDMRDKAPAVEALWSKYKEKLSAWERTKEGPSPKSPESAIREVRIHLLSQCASKARARALRSGLGLRTSYDRASLARPFCVASIFFSGESSDPALAREFALMRGAAFLQSTGALYGRAARELPPPPAPRGALPPGRPAPPVGTVVDEDGVIDAELVEESMPEAPPPSDHAPAPPTRAPAPARATRAQHEEASSDAVMRFGRAKGTRLMDADVDDLEWYVSALQRSVDDESKSRWRDDNQRQLDEALAELRRRDATGGDADDGGSSGGGGDDFEAAGRVRGDDDDIPF